ncbi:MAG: UbiA family prenyltransferase [Maricaulaceae bacterium]
MKNLNPLVIDVDGTLIRNDLTHELLLMGILMYPFKIFSFFALFFKSKAKLKEELVKLVGKQIEPAHLPFNSEVVERAKRHKSNGGDVVLCSGSEHSLIDKLASHLGWVDNAYGSTSNRNLISHTKAAFLSKKYPEGFTYIGNSSHDYPVWTKASEGLSVNAPSGTQSVKTASGDSVKTLVEKSSILKPCLKVLRLHQWAKNTLLFLVPALTIHVLGAVELAQLFLAFLAMGFMASGTYVFNDLIDIQNDRQHHSKKNRPFASGALGVGHGVCLMVTCLIVSALICLLLPPLFTLMLVIYLATTVLYTTFLKKKAIVDVLTLALLFTVRVIAGGAVIGIVASPWIISFVLAFFLSLSLTKRYIELEKISLQGKLQAVGRGYTTHDKPLILAFGMMATAMAMLSFTLYGVLAETPVLNSYISVFSIGIILAYWLMRMWLLAYRCELFDDPILFAVKDKHSILLGALILCIVFAEQVNLPWLNLF